MMEDSKDPATVIKMGKGGWVNRTSTADISSHCLD